MMELKRQFVLDFDKNFNIYKNCEQKRMNLPTGGIGNKRFQEVFGHWAKTIERMSEIDDEEEFKQELHNLKKDIEIAEAQVRKIQRNYKDYDCSPIVWTC